jgi:hypothetical protein
MVHGSLYQPFDYRPNANGQFVHRDQGKGHLFPSEERLSLGSLWLPRQRDGSDSLSNPANCTTTKPTGKDLRL